MARTRNLYYKESKVRRVKKETMKTTEKKEDGGTSGRIRDFKFIKEKNQIRALVEWKNSNDKEWIRLSKLEAPRSRLFISVHGLIACSRCTVLLYNCREEASCPKCGSVDDGEMKQQVTKKESVQEMKLEVTKKGTVKEMKQQVTKKESVH